ncbi:MAG: tRNA (adenosine(37)-N6)-threonylcarbamoyltransferase complex ATPase subunit type 1 TsaE [Bacteroidota bacterium]
MYEFYLSSEERIKDAARWFICHMNKHHIFSFSGEMGAGKTTLIKAICQELKVSENISSPSFALVYEYNSSLVGTIYHFDLYRIKEILELFDLGYEDYLYSGNICFIEWPEIAEELMPPETVEVHLEVLKDHSRKIIIIPPEKEA